MDYGILLIILGWSLIGFTSFVLCAFGCWYTGQDLKLSDLLGFGTFSVIAGPAYSVVYIAPTLRGIACIEAVIFGKDRVIFKGRQGKD